MREHSLQVEVLGPWSLRTSRLFWEGFAPAPLTGGPRPPVTDGETLTARFLVEADWQPADAVVTQVESRAHVTVSGEGDLDAAARQVQRFLSLDIDASAWPGIGRLDPVIGRAQGDMPGLRPCGFFSPYEAAAWAVISQRRRISDAARIRGDLIASTGRGTFPSPTELRAADLPLFAAQRRYLTAVAEAALDGVLRADRLRAMDGQAAIDDVRRIDGVGPFSSELIVIRGANHPDRVPRHEKRLATIVAAKYDEDLETISQRWRPLRSWAAVHLRAQGERAAAAAAA